jgi:hypothetical protein
MARNATEVEQVVSRTLRDSLDKLQRTTDEVNQAVSDLVSACASARPSNALPHMVRAQTSAASLAASLEVLSRFITASLHPDWRAPFAPPEAPAEARAEAPPTREESVSLEVVEEVTEPAPEPVMQVTSVAFEASQEEEQGVSMAEEPAQVDAWEAPILDEPPLEAVAAPSVDEPAAGAFDVLMLSPEEQELHRRANRVAKVSMQDIKMLRPDQVQLGRENNDLCQRLRDDIERARKEYDRRFQAILDHPVDYFYAWMVEVLAEGDPQALGEYPYPSPVLRQ